VTDSTTRFSNRAKDYARHRPGYPVEVLQVLKSEANLTPAAIVADIGSGTGISSRPFLELGNTVHAVEPNCEMRQVAEQTLGENSRFHSVEGTAEATTLPDGSVNYIVAGQAFHWFDRPKARREFSRILRPGGWVALIWNERLVGATPFLCQYEALVREFAVDYRQVDHRNIDEPVIKEFFSPGTFQLRRLPNAQSLDLEGLKGRLASSSYMPAADHPRHFATMKAVERMFDQHQQNGRVKIDYDTLVYFGQLGGR
jgi:ubiquinone/menaquinone biosynthesis C-methylase UbiE